MHRKKKPPNPTHVGCGRCEELCNGRKLPSADWRGTEELHKTRTKRYACTGPIVHPLYGRYSTSHVSDLVSAKAWCF